MPGARNQGAGFGRPALRRMLGTRHASRGVRMHCRGVWLGVLAVALARPALAHHSFAAEFDADKTAELSGKITQVWWANPHVRFRLHTAGAGAQEDWELQASSITALMALGWNQSTIKIGDELKVSGQVGRNGTKKLYVRTMLRPDGSKVVTGRGDGNQPDPNQVHVTAGKTFGYGNARKTYPVDITG